MKTLLLLFILIFGVGCAINPKYPINRFQSAESVESGANGNAFVSGSSDVLLETELVRSPINREPGELSTSIGLGGGIDIAVLENLDVGLDYTLSGPFKLKVKWQVLGDGQKNAKAWSHSFSILGSAGASIQSRTLVAQNGSNRVFWIGSVYHDYEFLLGLRFMDNLQITIGRWFAKYGVDIDMGEVQIDTSGEIDGYHLLTSYYFDRLAVKFDIAKYNNTYYNSRDVQLDSDSGIQFGLALDLSFE